jgi:dUTP pyrophosphatase
MKIQFKKLLPTAQKPKFGKPGDAGADLVATSIEWRGDLQIVYGTGLAVEIPEGMVGLVFPRSSVRDKNLSMANSVGVIDHSYRGEVKAYLVNNGTDPFPIKYGDRIAQLVLVPCALPEVELVEAVSTTERGEGGFGSTGKA